MLRRLIIPLGLVLAAACVPPVQAAEPSSPAAATAASTSPAPAPPTALAGDEVLVSAELLERRGEERVVIGAGAVTIRHRELRLVADRVVYNELTRDVVADGNVVLDSGTDRLQGEHLELNLGTRTGFLEHAQGFIQTYYFTSERIDKLGLDRYALHGGTFTSCEGVRPDWSIHATSADITVNEYLLAWNPSLWLRRVPVLYFPYGVFPIKPDRTTGLLIPMIRFSGTDGFTLRNAFYWAPGAAFDATVGLDYLERTGWGTSGEMRYLLAPRTRGLISAYHLDDTVAGARRWSFTSRNSQELPLGIQAEVEAFIQSDREFIAREGTTIEERSSESTRTAFYLNRSWSAWNFTFSGRDEESLLTERSTGLTRFPELTVDRTSTRLFGSGLFLKLSSSGVRLNREDTESSFSTTRLHVSPELTWPLSLGSIARVIPTAGYALTTYNRDTLDSEKTRQVPFYRIALEGPAVYRVWDLSSGGRFEKVKHLIEPSLTYVFTPQVDQDTLPLFDAIDRIAQTNRLSYSITNNVYAKVRPVAPTPAPGAPVEDARDPGLSDVGGGSAGPKASIPELPDAMSAGGQAQPQRTTQELLWFKISQSYDFGDEATAVAGRPFSALEWETRTGILSGLEVSWRGNVDAYGEGIGYQNVSLTWKPAASASIRADWRTARGSNQDFLDLGASLSLGGVSLDGRSRFNLAEETFVENRVNLKYASQCWELALGYVRWTDDYEYSLLLSLKGLGTLVKI